MSILPDLRLMPSISLRPGETRSPATPAQSLTSPGDFSAQVGPWESGEPYEFRAVVKHPVLTMYGDSRKTTLR